MLNLKSFLLGQSIFCDNAHTDICSSSRIIVVCTAYCALEKAGLERPRFRAAPNVLSVGTCCYVVDCRCGRLGGARRFGAHRGRRRGAEHILAAARLQLVKNAIKFNTKSNMDSISMQMLKILQDRVSIRKTEMYITGKASYCWYTRADDPCRFQ